MKRIGTHLRSLWHTSIPHMWAPFEIPPFKPITEGLSSGPPLLNAAISAGNLSDFLSRIFAIAIAVGAILAVLRIAYGGFVYMTTDAIGQKQTARVIIQNAVLGLILLLAVVVILERINPDLLSMKFTLPSASSGASSAPAVFDSSGLPVAR